MRQTREVTIDFGERDLGKTYVLTEMSASQAETWAWRALSAMARGNAEIPESVLALGWGAVALLGLRSILAADYIEVAPLLDEMMRCIRFKASAVRDLVETDIEDVATRVYLRDEVFKLHANFSVRERLLSLTAQLAGMGDASSSSPDTSTSVPQSDPSSPENSQP